MRQFILVVEGEVELTQMVERCLQSAGYEVGISPGDVLLEAQKIRPSLILVPATHADSNGLAFCQRIRGNPYLAATPVVLLLDDASEEHRVQALESGADDCLGKPFNPREIVARVQAVLRRLPRTALPALSGEADLVIDNWAMKLSVRGNEIPTTSLEFRLIDYLARHQGQVFTRDLLLDAVWGDMQFVTPRSVDACIRRIREKIEPDRKKPTFLKTIRGVGYRLDAWAVWQSTPNEGCNCAACVAAIQPVRAAQGSARRKRSAV